MPHAPRGGDIPPASRGPIHVAREVALVSAIGGVRRGGQSDDAPPDRPKVLGLHRGGGAGTSTSVGIRLAEVPGDDDDADLPSFSALADRTVFWYRGAERLLQRELAAIMSKASPDSRINPNSLGLDSLELLQLCMGHQNAWQEVCLVIERDERTGRSVTVTIKRPMAFKLSSWGGWSYWGPGRNASA